VTKNLHYTYPTEADLGAMKVKLAVQVLSRSVGIGLRESGDEDVIGAAELCDMMNGFFDCTNVRSLTECLSIPEKRIHPSCHIPLLTTIV
jgi:hypothetical protein